MTYENKTGLGIFTQYGTRSTGNSVGTDNTPGATSELNLEVSGNSLQSLFLPPYTVPKGAKFVRATLVVHEAFTLTGTTPTLQIGGTAPGTNGLTLSAAQLGAVASVDVSSALAGTWATASTTGATASEKVTLALGGTTPAVTAGVGKASIVMQYIYKNRTLGASN